MSDGGRVTQGEQLSGHIRLTLMGEADSCGQTGSEQTQDCGETKREVLTRGL